MRGLDSEITSVFNTDVPQVPMKFRFRQFFGGQKFAQESLIALFEGLISEADYENVRSVFLNAIKIRAQLEADYISQQEYYAHAITLFQNFISLEDKTTEDDSDNINSGTTSVETHNNDMHVPDVIDVHALDGRNMHALDSPHEEKKQIHQQQQQLHNTEKIGQQKHQKNSDQLQQKISQNGQNEQNQQNVSEKATQKLSNRQNEQNQQKVPEKVPEKATQKLQYRQNEQNQQNVPEKAMQNLQNRQIDTNSEKKQTVNKIEGFVVKNQNLKTSDEQLQKEEPKKSNLTSQNIVQKGRQYRGSQETISVHGGTSELSEEHDEFRNEIVGGEVYKEQERGNVSPYRQQGVNSGRGQDPLMKFLSQNASPREKSVRKLKWDSEENLPENNHVAKNYLRKVAGNLEESDSASNPSEPLSPAPSVTGYKEDQTGLSKVDEKSSDVQSVLSVNKKEGELSSKRSFSPSPHFIRESMKSPTSSERSINTQFSASSLQRKPTMVRDFGAKKRIENKKSGITGFQLAEDALNLYEEMRLHHTYKWLILELNPTTKEIDVSDFGEADSTFQDLVDALPHYKCCYAVYNQGERSWGLLKIVMVNWCPEGSPVKQRMIYASSKDFLKQFLGNVTVEVQATERDDLDEQSILAQIR